MILADDCPVSQYENTLNLYKFVMPFLTEVEVNEVNKGLVVNRDMLVKWS